MKESFPAVVGGIVESLGLTRCGRQEWMIEVLPLVVRADLERRRFLKGYFLNWRLCHAAQPGKRSRETVLAFGRDPGLRPADSAAFQRLMGDPQGVAADAKAKDLLAALIGRQLDILLSWRDPRNLGRAARRTGVRMLFPRDELESYLKTQSGFLDDIRRRGGKHPDICEFSAYFLVWGGAALLSKWALLRLGITKKCVVGFDEGDFAVVLD